METLAGVREHLPGRPGGERTGFGREEWRTAGKLGLLGLCLPHEYGGAGLGALDTALALEAFGQGCTDMGLVFAVSACWPGRSRSPATRRRATSWSPTR